MVPTLHSAYDFARSIRQTTSYPDYLSELALAHVDRDKTRAAYARGDLLEERRPMMEAWGKFCTEPLAAVANINAERQRKGRLA